MAPRIAGQVELTLSPRTECASRHLVPQLSALLARELLALLGSEQTLILIHLLLILPHPGDLRENIVRRAGVIRYGAVVAHLVQETGDALLDMRLAYMRRALAAAMALLRGRALALALAAVGGLAVLLLLSLQLHLALVNGLRLRSLLHGSLLSLLRVHARPETADIARRFLLAAHGGRVDEVV